MTREGQFQKFVFWKFEKVGSKTPKKGSVTIWPKHYHFGSYFDHRSCKTLKKQPNIPFFNCSLTSKVKIGPKMANFWPNSGWNLFLGSSTPLSQIFRKKTIFEIFLFIWSDNYSNLSDVCSDRIFGMFRFVLKFYNYSCIPWLIFKEIPFFWAIPIWWRLHK